MSNLQGDVKKSAKRCQSSKGPGDAQMPGTGFIQMANDFLSRPNPFSEGHPDKAGDQISDAILTRFSNKTPAVWQPRR